MNRTLAFRRAGRLLALCLLLLPALPGGAGRAEEKPLPAPREPVSLVTILQEDHQGNALRFPSFLAFDQDQDEVYVLSGGVRGFIIHDNTLFPYLFLGPGRGLDSPQGVFFDPRDGRVFVCQGRSATQPPRLTILDGAFFPAGEIFLAGMPGAENFSPGRGVVGRTGNIYLAGSGSRGVLVLAPDGQFLRWLKPMDSVLGQDGEEAAGEMPQEPAAAGGEAGDNPLGLPAELLPASRLKAARAEAGPGQGPVAVNDIIRDSEGRLFLLSEETSKVYVYGSNEELLFSFGQKGGSSGKMSRPRGLAIDEARKSIYIVDYMRHTILVFDTGGKYLFEFGGRGTGPLWFNFPTAISVNRRGQIFIADLFNNRVQVLKAEFDVRFPLFQGAAKSERPAGPGLPEAGAREPGAGEPEPFLPEPFSEEPLPPQANE
jgi:DNA-binding beta-propeller fold protein YncE